MISIRERKEKAARGEYAKAMRDLSDDQRLAAIHASDNVVGFGQMCQRAQSVRLEDSYAKPQGPTPGGHA